MHQKVADKAAPKAPALATAIKAWERYVQAYPQPLEPAVDARWHLVALTQQDGQLPRSTAWVRAVQQADADAGAARTPRTRMLGGLATLRLAEPALQAYKQVPLIEPLQKQLKLKKAKMDEVLKAYAAAADVGVAEVTTAATFHTAALYQDFGKSLIGSQRPTKLSKMELEQYSVLLEEQAFPFEEKAIDLHETNARRTAAGLYDNWVKSSLGELAKLKPVRYGKGSNAMALMQTVLADDTPGQSRVRTWLRELWAQRRTAFDLYDFKHWSERTVIALVMQTFDNSITTKGVKGRFGWRMTSEQGHGLPNPTYIPVAYEATRRIADVLGGTAGGNVGEVFNRLLTAHFIGGCTIGDSPESGVVDPWQRLFGHEGLHVVDGSTVSANLGVNPSLTITAQAERAMAFWPNKGEADPRPALGSAYRLLAPVEPKNPVVPAAAPGALRLPIVGVS